MNQFLRSLTPTQQVGALFIIVFGILILVSVAAFLLTLRERANDHDEAWHAELKNFRNLLGTSWFMVVVFWMAWAAGDTVATVLFALIAFFALREFITLVADAPRRPPQPDPGLLRGAADPVLAGGHATLRPVHGVHPGLRVPGDSRGERAGRRHAALPGAQRQAAVGHHGLRLRHEPRARAAAAGLPGLPGQGRLPGVLPGHAWCRPACWCSTC